MRRPTARSLDRIEPYGGFGLETMQTPFVGTVMMDRFGLVHRVSLPEPSTGRVAQHSRDRRRAVRCRAGGRAATAHQLPTGSLDWAGASGVLALFAGASLPELWRRIRPRAVRQHRLRYDVPWNVARLLIREQGEDHAMLHDAALTRGGFRGDSPACDRRAVPPGLRRWRAIRRRTA